jgi:hypothetical protein
LLEYGQIPHLSNLHVDSRLSQMGKSIGCCFEKPKSEIYQDLLPPINSGAVDLPDNDRLQQQLVTLERRTSRGGRDSIDHTPGAHDDVANAVAGAAVTAFKEPGLADFDRPLDWRKYGVGLV